MAVEETRIPFSRAEIGHCRVCGVTVRRTVTGIRVRRQSWGICGFKSGTRDVEVKGDAPVPCKCPNKWLTMRPILGIKVPEIPCDARCVSAKGHSCECSCGGENHGKAHQF